MQDQRITSGDAQLLAILDGLPIGVMLRARDGGLLHANPAFVRFLDRLGVTVEDVRASPAALLEHIEVVDEDGLPFTPEEVPVAAVMARGTRQDVTMGYGLPEGGHAWYRIHAEPLALADGTTGTVVTVDDVTHRKALEAELRAAAVEDPLTRLANRRALAEGLDRARRQQRRAGADIGLLYLDVDGLKAINDAHGHEAGDRILVRVGHRLRSATRETDLVCRLGGDEFVVLCAPVAGIEGLQHLADRIASAAPPQIQVDGVAVWARMSVGAALVEPDEGLDRALGRADAAMYDAKRRVRQAG